jgi:hypothetical protein
MNDVGVNLAQSNERPKIPAVGSAKCPEERGAVALNRGFGVVFSKSEVERFVSVGAREPSDAGGKSVNEPGKFAQVWGAKNVELALLRDPVRHETMLTEPRLGRHFGPRDLLCSAMSWHRSSDVEKPARFQCRQRMISIV